MVKKTRCESFLGMHFDFHAGLDQKNIGENCDPEAIGAMLDAVRPDYVQCDTKGHAGATSYPTKVGYPAPEIKADILKMWREETNQRGVALYAHHSGVWDDNALIHHPEWAAENDKGERSREKTSVFGPYAEKILIPQLIEMAVDYGLDGAWVDGDIWAAIVDYSAHALDVWAKEHAAPPPKPGEDGYFEYAEFCRQGFRDYVARYAEAVHRAAPGFQIASNWMYSSFSPEKPTVPVDFLSGDYSPSDSVNTARFEGRCLMNQGKPWDLMAWGFNLGEDGHCVKELAQLCQEAAAVIMLGGGFQFYNRQMVGSVQKWAVPMWERLAEFCRARENCCFLARPVPQVGLIYSAKGFYHEKADLFTCYNSFYAKDLRGALYLALDNQFSAEVLLTHQAMERDLSAYGALIIPDLPAIEDGLREKLLAYARAGGSLIVAGADSTRLFERELGVRVSPPEAESCVYLPGGEQIAPIRTRRVSVDPDGAEEFLPMYTDNDIGKDLKQTAATVKEYGRGRLYGVYLSLGAYQNMKSVALRDFFGGVLRRAFPSPAVTVKGSRLIEVSLMEKDGARIVNLLNLAGAHADAKTRSFGEIPPLFGIGITVACPEAPAEVYLEPGRAPVDYRYAGGRISFTLENLAIHTAVVIR